jgi:catechol 1,2-dioxygenase
MHSTSDSRRRILLAAFGVAAFPLRPVWAMNCVPAVSNILGPAYRKGAPFRTRLCAPEEPGTALTMRGRIVDAHSCAVLPGAVLDVWQVNQAGDYDMQSAAFRLRGRLRADANGRYAFDTIMPVPYGRRPKHIHFLITRAGYEPRITQCYFAGDERNASDPYVKPELVITPRQHTSRKAAFEGSLDIALERERAVSAADAAVFPDYAGDYEVAPGVIVSISAAANRLRWHLSAAEDDGDALDGELVARSRTRFRIPEYDMGVTFVRDEHGTVTHTLTDDGHLAKKIR